MLVLARKVGSRVVISDNIEVTILEISGNRVRLGVTAPIHMSIARCDMRKIAKEHRDQERIDQKKWECPHRSIGD